MSQAAAATPFQLPVAVGQTTESITVTPSAAPTLNGVTLSIACGAGTPVPDTLTFPQGSLIARTFTFTAPSSVGVATCSFTLSGNDAAGWNAVLPRAFDVRVQGTFSWRRRWAARLRCRCPRLWP